MFHSVVTAISVLATVCLLGFYHKVEVVGPKVAAVIHSLRRLFRIHAVTGTDKKHDQDARLDIDTARLASRDAQNFDVDVANGRHSLEMLTVSARFEGTMKTMNGQENVTYADDDDTRSTVLVWRDAAETLDYVFFRLFRCDIVGMTSLLVVTLFVGQ